MKRPVPIEIRVSMDHLVDVCPREEDARWHVLSLCKDAGIPAAPIKDKYLGYDGKFSVTSGVLESTMDHDKVMVLRWTPDPQPPLMQRMWSATKRVAKLIWEL